MFRIQGSRRALCDGLSRRTFLQASAALSGLGAAAPVMTTAARANDDAAAVPGFGRAKSVILLFLYGGMSQLETFDPKPDAPVEVRGVFDSIATAIPDYRVCEGLPRIAQMIDRTTVIRSMSHPFPIHGTAYSVTATPFLETPMQDNPRDGRHWPYIGSVVEYLDEKRGRPATSIPPNLGLPFLHSSKRRHVIHNAGPYAAYLGRAYDPVWTEFTGEALHEQKYHFSSQVATIKDPYGGVQPDCKFHFADQQTLPAEISLDRLDRRRSLLEQFEESRRALDAQSRIQDFNRTRARAFDFLTNRQLQEALDLQRESQATRDQYGMTLFGQGALLARRMVQAGGRFVSLFWDEFGLVNSAWDTHYWHYPRLREQLLPGLDQAYSALILDLEQRGMLDETLVVAITEHGRTPKLDPNGDHPSGTGQGGRNHWSRAYSSVLAGAGIARGKLVGRTDKIAADVIDRPVAPADILATIYHLLGISPETLIHDSLGRPFPIAGHGRILHEALA